MRGLTPPRGCMRVVGGRPRRARPSADKMRSPQTTGDAEPRPGISTFHLMFLVSLHSSGGFADGDTPRGMRAAPLRPELIAWAIRRLRRSRSARAAMAASPNWKTVRMPDTINTPSCRMVTLIAEAQPWPVRALRRRRRQRLARAMNQTVAGEAAVSSHGAQKVPMRATELSEQEKRAEHHSSRLRRRRGAFSQFCDIVRDAIPLGVGAVLAGKRRDRRSGGRTARRSTPTGRHERPRSHA